MIGDAIRDGDRFTFYRWKCIRCDFQWNVDPKTQELTWRWRRVPKPDGGIGAVWKSVPDGCLLVVEG